MNSVSILDSASEPWEVKPRIRGGVVSVCAELAMTSSGSRRKLHKTRRDMPLVTDTFKESCCLLVNITKVIQIVWHKENRGISWTKITDELRSVTSLPECLGALSECLTGPSTGFAGPSRMSHEPGEYIYICAGSRMSRGECHSFGNMCYCVLQDSGDFLDFVMAQNKRRGEEYVVASAAIDTALGGVDGHVLV